MLPLVIPPSLLPNIAVIPILHGDSTGIVTMTFLARKLKYTRLTRGEPWMIPQNDSAGCKNAIVEIINRITE